MTTRPATAHARAALAELRTWLPDCDLRFETGRKHAAIEVQGRGRRERYHLSNGAREPYLERGWARQWARRFLAMESANG